MRINYLSKSIIFVLLIIFLVSCQATRTAEIKAQPTQTVAKIQISPVKPLNPVITKQPTSLPTSIPTPIASLPQEFIDATVWEQDPQVPILQYHRFLPNTYPQSYPTKTLLRDFETELQTLYDNDFTIVSLQDWISGNLQVPSGRRPIIITLDDAFFADQIFLENDGLPSTNSGIGALWEFSKDILVLGLLLRYLLTWVIRSMEILKWGIGMKMDPVGRTASQM